MNKLIQPTLVAAVALTLSACGSMSTSTPAPATAPVVPAAIAVPATAKLAMTLVGTGSLYFECRETAGAFAWALAAPDAVLTDAKGAKVGKYYAGPTWDHTDGSKVTGKQLAVSPSPGNLALQLVQANPATGNGAFTGVTYIQRLNTKGGATPADPCNAATVKAQKTVSYAADYVFYK